MTTPDPSPGPLLPDRPLKRSDMPVDGKLHLGRLVAFPAPTGRPLVGVLVTCPRCKRLHRYPWRWDWGLDPDVVSLQQTRCRKPPRPCWVALDPAAGAENVATHRAAHEAFQAWQAERSARKAAASRPGGGHQ